MSDVRKVSVLAVDDSKTMLRQTVRARRQLDYDAAQSLRDHDHSLSAAG